MEAANRSSFDVAQSLLQTQEQGVEVVLVCTRDHLKKQPVVLTRVGHFGGDPHIQFEDPIAKAKGSGYVDWIASESVEEVHPLSRELQEE